MKTLLVPLAIWILMLPDLVTMFMLFTFVAKLSPSVHLILVRLALVFAALCSAVGNTQIHYRRRIMKSATSKRSVLRSSFRCAVLCLLFATLPALADTGTGVGRTVKYSQHDIVTVRAKVRYSTLIVLPQNEEILDFATGDKEFWIINGAHNLCYIHPAQAGIRTDLHLITASGHVYSFLLTEISKDASVELDFKLFIEPKEESSIGGGTALEGYVRAGEVEAYKRDLAALHAQTDEQIHAAEARAAAQINKFRADFAGKVQFDYQMDKKAAGEPFLVSAIYHDDAFTYIKCAAREKPALYEIKDGKPNLINFQLENGVYIIPKVLDQGYLAIGKKKFVFSRRGE